MNSTDTHYDVIIIGGGLAGLALAIQLCKVRKTVLVIEKEDYPRHKVCGEYISMESWPFLESLGLPLAAMDLPVINQLLVTDVKGHALNTDLIPGGFGISRYQLDAALAGILQQEGGALLTRRKVEQVHFDNGLFTVHAQQQQFTAQVVAGAWGKRSNMDIKWQQQSTKVKKQSSDNYIGIKYHITYQFPSSLIALHNFHHGYCGLSNVEDGKSCLCYLTRASNLQRAGNDIRQMEQTILIQNPYLKKIFTEATFLWKQPVAISQINFQQKEQVHDHILLLGDAAGMIAPLCGNGMSMALHSSKLAFEAIFGFLSQRISRKEMEDCYRREWQRQFATRLAAGRMLQANLGKDRTTSLLLRTIKLFPGIQQTLIRATFGHPF